MDVTTTPHSLLIIFLASLSFFILHSYFTLEFIFFHYTDVLFLDYYFSNIAII
jgi:hypothetical protein